MPTPSLQIAGSIDGWLVKSEVGIFPIRGEFNPFSLSLKLLFEQLLQATAQAPLEEVPEVIAPFNPTQTPILGAGVTFANSHRERRLEAIRVGSLATVDDDGRPTPYDVVYDTANPPEVFFKATSLGHLADPAEIWIRPDGAPDGSTGSSVPEPERILIVNARGEIIAETIGSDTTARQLESLSPLYLPAAKTYPGSTTINPWLTVFNPETPREPVEIRMRIWRGNGELMYDDVYSSDQMKRTPESLVIHARSLADNPKGIFESGFALFTGTGIIPPLSFSLQADDIVQIESPQLGSIRAVTRIVKYEF
jgi:2-dehydro-3-deoxy-D-arabinonate dehydratase